MWRHECIEAASATCVAFNGKVPSVRDFSSLGEIGLAASEGTSTQRRRPLLPDQWSVRSTDSKVTLATSVAKPPPSALSSAAGW